MSKNPFSFSIKIIAIFTLTAFITLTFNNFIYAVSPKVSLDFNESYLSSDLAKITEKYKGENGQKIYIIQNYHCHYEAQAKIRDIIKILKQKHSKRLSVVGIEGSFDKIDTSVLGKITDIKAKKEIIDYFVDQGYITGPELYDIEYPGQIILYGIEDEKLYLKDFNLLCRSLEYKKDMEEILIKVRNVIDRGKDLMYIPSLKELEIEKDKYKKGEMDLSEYLEFIITRYKKHVSDEFRMDNINIFRRANEMGKYINKGLIHIETKHLLTQLEARLKEQELNTLKTDDIYEYYSQLHRLMKNKGIIIGEDYKELKKYFKYLETKEKIDESELFQEIEYIEYAIKKELSKDLKDISKLVYSDRYLEIFEKLINNEATAKQIEYMTRNKDQFYITVKELIGKLSARNYIDENIELIKEAEENIKNFYHLAVKRNEALVQNMLNHLSSNSKDLRVGIMVVGGFHTKGITQILRTRNISYEVIMPKIKAVYDEKDKYTRRLKEQAEWLGKGRLENKKYFNDVTKVDKLECISIFSDDPINVFREILDYLFDDDFKNMKFFLKLKEELPPLMFKKLVDGMSFYAKEQGNLKEIYPSLERLLGFAIKGYIPRGAFLEYTDKADMKQLVLGIKRGISRIDRKVDRVEDKVDGLHEKADEGLDMQRLGF